MWNDFKFRIGIKRDSYLVKPGIYKVGDPTPDSKVYVSANFQMSFNRLRKALIGEQAWILVIDTKGINVWCAAGKGTFGTDELLGKIREFKLDEVVTNRELILPQLGAPGVDGNKISSESGFKVFWGPVHTRDLKRYISSSYKKDEKMMRVTFNLFERLAVVPLELIASIKYVLLITLLLFGVFKFSLEAIPVVGGFILAWLTGTVLFPALLPMLPLRSFAVKGFYLSAVVTAIYNYFVGMDANTVLCWSTLLLNASFSSFWALNFTGCSTFTSPRGVEKELRIFLKPIFVLMFLGAVGISLVGLGVL